jgi:hypothetical protein
LELYALTRRSRRKWEHAYRRRKPERHLFNNARARARRDGLEFNIELSDVVVPRLCPVLGVPLVVRGGKGTNPNSPTLDRIIPKLGYIKGNVAVISDRANRIKSDATVDEVAAVARWLRKVLKTKREKKTSY